MDLSEGLRGVLAGERQAGIPIMNKSLQHRLKELWSVCKDGKNSSTGAKAKANTVKEHLLESNFPPGYIFA